MGRHIGRHLVYSGVAPGEYTAPAEGQGRGVSYEPDGFAFRASYSAALSGLPQASYSRTRRSAFVPRPPCSSPSSAFTMPYASTSFSSASR